MFDLMQGLMASELAADRLREAEQQRLRRAASARHRREVERVRASVQLLPRTRPNDPREA
jgi:hypothetical protein